MVNIVLNKRSHPESPHPTVGMMRPVTSTSEPSPPSNSYKKQATGSTIHPLIGGKLVPQSGLYEGRRTRGHVKKLNDLNPYVDWINEEGLQFESKHRRSPTPYSPKYSLDWQGDNFEVFEDEFDLDLGEPAIAVEEKLVTSHLERTFNGEKMWWGREDWEENSKEVLKEEERIREKRRRDRKERERKGGLGAIQRRRKWRESKRASLTKKEEQDIDVKMELDLKMEVNTEFEAKMEVDTKMENEMKAEADVKTKIEMKNEVEMKMEVKTEIGIKSEAKMKTEFETKAEADVKSEMEMKDFV